MYKIFIIPFLILTFFLNPSITKAEDTASDQTMDAEMLKCLLSGICDSFEESNKTPIQAATITKIEGEVTVEHPDGTEEALIQGMIIKTGDYINTGFEARVELDFGYGKLTVYSVTRLRIDEYVNEENIKKSQLYLTTGRISPILPHTAAIRGDFSVRTIGGNSSIRGSQMLVEVDGSRNRTFITALDGETYFLSKKSTNEITLTAGKKITIEEDGTISKEEAVGEAELSELKTSPFIDQKNNSENKIITEQTTANETTETKDNNFILILSLVIIVVALIIIVIAKKRKK